MNAPCGFDQRFIVENKDRFHRPRFYDDWDIHLHQLGVEYPTRLTYAKRDDYPTALGAYEWHLPENLHWDAYVGRNAEWLIRDYVQDKPLFMQIGFPGPHPPYDPPQRYLDMIDPETLPEASPFDRDCEIPVHYEYRHVMMDGHDAIQWSDEPTRDQLKRLRHHYAANMLMIDEQINAIIGALEETGMLENSVIVFTSDHGDNLGDHGQIQKWTMHDAVTRVPTITWAPKRLPQGRRIDSLIQQMDLAPMLFELAGIELDQTHDALNAMRTLDGETIREFVYAEHGGCNMLKNIDKMSMVRSRNWKLVDYPGMDYGELYDMKTDPLETINLWNSLDHGDIQTEFQRQADAFNQKKDRI
jgi:arylsulfatase A-like enzyme